MIKPNIYFFSPKEKIIPDNIEAFLKSSKIEDIRKILNDFPNLENKILGIRSTSIPMEVLSKIQKTIDFFHITSDFYIDSDKNLIYTDSTFLATCFINNVRNKGIFFTLEVLNRAKD